MDILYDIIMLTHQTATLQRPGEVCALCAHLVFRQNIVVNRIINAFSGLRQMRSTRTFRRSHFL